MSDTYSFGAGWSDIWMPKLVQVVLSECLVLMMVSVEMMNSVVRIRKTPILQVEMALVMPVSVREILTVMGI